MKEKPIAIRYVLLPREKWYLVPGQHPYDHIAKIVQYGSKFYIYYKVGTIDCIDSSTLKA